MLIKCPECELQVSDKALLCPHCGYPLKNNAKSRKSNKSNKRRRLPNGFGQISEIKNRNLRKPFRAMVTTGKNPNGRPICKPLKPESYFLTYNDAYAALVEYNKNPYDLEPSITVKELYEKWTDVYFETLKSNSSVCTMKRAWLYCSSVYNMRVKDIRGRHVKGCINDGYILENDKKKYPNSLMKSKIKTLFNIMLDYALEYELVDKNYSKTFTLTNDIIKEATSVKNKHLVFTDEEINVLWANVNNIKYIDVILIQCYSGWRPKELGLLKLEDIDLKNRTFKGGIKTESGIDRIVPIHSKIYDLVVQKYKEAVKLNSPYLINYTQKSNKLNKTTFTYDRYHNIFKSIISDLKLNNDHRPHDGRKHFVTVAKKYGVDEYAIKYIVGHKISDITEKVYTNREFDWLKEEMEKIK